MPHVEYAGVLCLLGVIHSLGATCKNTAVITKAVNDHQPWITLHAAYQAGTCDILQVMAWCSGTQMICQLPL